MLDPIEAAYSRCEDCTPWGAMFVHAALATEVGETVTVRDVLESSCASNLVPYHLFWSAKELGWFGRWLRQSGYLELAGSSEGEPAYRVSGEVTQTYAADDRRILQDLDEGVPFKN